jgi:hypothetical protein
MAHSIILEGPFRAHDEGAGVWRLQAEPPRGVRVYLVGVAGTPPAGSAQPASAISLEWHSGGVRLSSHPPPAGAAKAGPVGGQQTSFDARQALVHEPLPALYESLPLQRLDRRARRFWARVFLLVRLPGGRALLNQWARRRR